MNIFKTFWNWLTGRNEYGNKLVAALSAAPLVSWNSEGKVSGALGSFVNKYTGNALTGAENEANVFNAQEAQKNRDWQTEMSNTSYQRSVADMRAAGINPALAIGNSSGASTPSGSTASSVSPANNPIGLSEIMQLFQFRKQMKLLDQEVKNKKAQEALDLANARFSDFQSKLKGMELEVFKPRTDLELRTMESQLKSQEVHRALESQGIKESEAREALTIQQKVIAQIDAKYRERLQNLEAQQRVASIALTYNESAVARERVNNLRAATNELYQRAILEAAQAGLFDQQTENLLVQNDILKLDKETHQFTVNHQNADRNWRIAGQVIGGITSVAGAAGSMMTGIGVLGKAAGAFGQAVPFMQQQKIMYPMSTSYGPAWATYD